MTHEKYPYMGAIVLGMHDALVSVLGLGTGLAVAGADYTTIIMTGIIASVAAAFSMAASQYLAEKANGNYSHAIKSGTVTGISYVLTSLIMLIPFFITPDNVFYALYAMYGVAGATILVFNFIKSRVHKTPFWGHAIEMLIIYSVVSATAFLIGVIAKNLFGIEI